MLKAKNTHGRECPALVRGAFPSVCPWPSVCWSKVSPRPPTRSRLRSCRLWRGKATPSGSSRLDPDWPYVLQRTVGFEADLVEFNKNGLSPTDLQQRSRGARGAEHCGAPGARTPGALGNCAHARAPRGAVHPRLRLNGEDEDGREGRGPVSWTEGDAERACGKARARTCGAGRHPPLLAVLPHAHAAPVARRGVAAGALPHLEADAAGGAAGRPGGPGRPAAVPAETKQRGR